MKLTQEVKDEDEHQWNCIKAADRTVKQKVTDEIKRWLTDNDWRQLKHRLNINKCCACRKDIRCQLSCKDWKQRSRQFKCWLNHQFLSQQRRNISAWKQLWLQQAFRQEVTQTVNEIQIFNKVNTLDILVYFTKDGSITYCLMQQGNKMISCKILKDMWIKTLLEATRERKLGRNSLTSKESLKKNHIGGLKMWYTSKNRAKIHQNHQIPPESPNHSSLIAPQTAHFTTTSLYCNICLSLEQKKRNKKDSISINTHIIPFISGCFSPYFVLHLDTASTCLLCLMFQST